MRKILFGFILLGVGIAMDKLVPGGLSNNLVQLMQFIAGGFFLANSVEHVSTAIQVKALAGDVDGDGDVDGLDTQLQAMTDKCSALESQLAEVKEQNVNVLKGLATLQQAMSFVITKAGFDKK